MKWEELQQQLIDSEYYYWHTDNGVLLNGDCLEVMKEIPKECIDLILTDPPYLINYKTNYRKDKKHDFCNPIQNDNNYELISEFIKRSYDLLKNNKAFYCFTSWKKIDYFKTEIEKYYNIKNIIVWVKNNWTAGDLKAQFGQQYENIIYANKGRAFFNGKRDSDVWFFNRVSGKKQKHQNEKPLDLIEHVLNKHSNKNDVVLDCFAGSGSTLLGCEKLNRKWIGIELNEEYCEIVKQRIEGDL